MRPSIHDTPPKRGLKTCGVSTPRADIPYGFFVRVDFLRPKNWEKKNAASDWSTLANAAFGSRVSRFGQEPVTCIWVTSVQRIDLFGRFFKQKKKHFEKPRGFLGLLCSYIFHRICIIFFGFFKSFSLKFCPFHPPGVVFGLYWVLSSTEDHDFPPQGKPSSKKFCLFFFTWICFFLGGDFWLSTMANHHLREYVLLFQALNKEIQGSYSWVITWSSLINPPFITRLTRSLGDFHVIPSHGRSPSVSSRGQESRGALFDRWVVGSFGCRFTGFFHPTLDDDLWLVNQTPHPP